MMKITVLGSGTAIQFQNRASAAYLIEFNNNKFLFDCGFFLLDRLEKINVKIEEIDYIFLSHKHPDHFMGFIHFLFALKNSYYKREKPLKVFGFNGLKKYIKDFENILGKWIQPDIDIIISEGKSVNYGDFQLSLFDTYHSEESCGIKLSTNGLTIVYTGDSDYHMLLKKHFFNVDLAIVDCGSSCRNKILGHMCIKEIENLVLNNNVKQVILSHFYPESYFEILNYNLPSNFILARDFLSIELLKNHIS